MPPRGAIAGDLMSSAQFQMFGVSLHGHMSRVSQHLAAGIQATLEDPKVHLAPILDCASEVDLQLDVKHGHYGHNFFSSADETIKRELMEPNSRL